MSVLECEHEQLQSTAIKRIGRCKVNTYVRYVFIAVVCFFSSGSLAAEDYKPIIRIDAERSVIDLNADATYVETLEVEMSALNDQGASLLSQQNVSFSESLETIDVLEAYTLKTDGKRTEVPQQNIQDRSVVATGGPMFSDIKAKVIVFPGVSAGDKVVYKVRRHQKQAMFPGHFSIFRVFSDAVAYGGSEIEITAPKGALDLQIHAKDIAGGAIPDKGGRQRWKWTYASDKVNLPEVGAVAPIEYAPQLLVSTFKDYAQIASAYEARAHGKAAITDKVKATANDVTSGVSDPAEQARKLYTWVSQNIRYAGNCIGIGSVVPHDVDTILSNRLGDCKDHTALLEALLAAKGIESTAVLVNSGAIHSLPKVAVPAVFNHVINYIPSLNLYADATAKFVPFGLLPIGEVGKPVLHTKRFNGVQKTPAMDSKDIRSTMQMSVRIKEDGSADGEVSVEEVGILGAGVRASMADLQPEMGERIAQQLLAGSGFIGSGKASWSDMKAMDEPLRYAMSFHLDSLLDLPGPGALHVVPVMQGALSTALFAATASIPPIKQDHFCFGGKTVETYRYEFPPGVKLTSTPKGTQTTINETEYRSEYQRSGNVLTVTRSVDSRGPSKLCTPADLEQQRAMAKIIAKDLRAQILYE